MSTEFNDGIITTLQEEKDRFEKAKKITYSDGWVIYHCTQGYDPSWNGSAVLPRTLSLGLWNIIFYWFCCRQRCEDAPGYVWLANKEFKIPDVNLDRHGLGDYDLNGCEDYSACYLITDEDMKQFYDKYYKEYA